MITKKLIIYHNKMQKTCTDNKIVKTKFSDCDQKLMVHEIFDVLGTSHSQITKTDLLHASKVVRSWCLIYGNRVVTVDKYRV